MSEASIRFTREHEWVMMRNGIATIGISDFAQNQLGDIVSIELPKVGSTFKQMQAMAIVDSVKASSDIFSPLSGVVSEINENLLEQPELINQSPYESGWMLKIKPSQHSEFDSLMTKEDYDRFVGEESEKKKIKRDEYKISQVNDKANREGDDNNIMNYVPTTKQDEKIMLEKIGVKSIDNLVDSFHPTLSNESSGFASTFD